MSPGQPPDWAWLGHGLSRIAPVESRMSPVQPRFTPDELRMLPVEPRIVPGLYKRNDFSGSNQFQIRQRKKTSGSWWLTEKLLLLLLLLLPAPSLSLWSRFHKITIRILTMPQGWKLWWRLSAPRETDPGADSSFILNTKKKMVDLEVSPPSPPCANAPRCSDVRDNCILCAAGKEEAEGCTSPSIQWAAWRHVWMAQEPWLYIYQGSFEI